MADTPLTISDLNQTDNEATLNIGDLRRGYAFTSGRLATLNIAQDPLFNILATKRNSPVNDTHFKITEERPFLWKRYAYVVSHKAWSGSGSCPTTGFSIASDISAHTPQTAGSFFAVEMKTDYLSSGNRGNVYGQATGATAIGATGTLPIFFLENQLIKICTSSAYGDFVADDYIICRIKDVQTSSQSAFLGLVVIRALKTAANKHLCSFTAAATPLSNTYDLSLGHDVGGTKTIMETARTYVVGNAYKSGSGLPDTYNDQPFSTRYGLTMIQKHSLSMDGSTKATELKIVANEFDRLWAQKVLLHKWDIGNEIYYSTLYEDSDGTRHTQGVVDWAINYGNVFSLATTKTQDDFLEDISTLTDPRYNPMSNYLFVVPTYWSNWFHKLAGYQYNNLMLGNATDNRGAIYNFDFAGSRKIGGADVFEYSTFHGPMYVMKDIHLDGSPVKMLGIPMNNILYRPLAGNGENRDTTIFPGVQTIGTTGVDATVNLIM